MVNNFEKTFIHPNEVGGGKLDKLKLSRRQFLKAAGTAAVLKSVEGVGEVLAGVGGIGNTAKKEKAVGATEKTGDVPDISNQIIAKVENPGINIEVEPEYSRNLSRLMLTIPGDYEGDDFDAVYGDLISNLPSYTEIDIIANKSQIPLIKSKIKNHQTNILSSEKIDLQIELWSQDYGEAVRIDGCDKILVPNKISEDNPGAFAGDTERSGVRDEVLENFIGENNLLKADFFFEGGNVTFDKSDKGLRVFIGYNDLMVESGNWKDKDVRKIAEKISRQFGGAEVVVMGDDHQKAPLVHIDQSFIILDNKTAVVNQYDDNDGNESGQFVKIKRQHDYYRAQLEHLGYNVTSIKNTYADAINCLTSVNAIPFVDKNTGRKKIIFPVYDGEVAGDFNNLKHIKPMMLKGKALIAYEAYLKADYDPIPVRDIVTHQLHGNTHCLTNV